MKKVFSSDNQMIAGFLQGILENENIKCFIKNQALSGGIGELPPTECWPELWVVDDDDYQKALNIIEQVNLETDPKSKPWRCSCGETNEGQFGSCWQCGSDRIV